MPSDNPRSRIIEEIERAFADVPYPGHDQIVENPKDKESAKLRDRLKQKHWTTVPLNILLDERSSLPLMTPDAFRFFLPAFMHASLVYPKQADVIPENIVFHLTPPEEEGERAAWFRQVVAGFTTPQVETIRAFIHYWLESIAPSARLDSDLRAERFWSELKPS